MLIFFKIWVLYVGRKIQMFSVVYTGQKMKQKIAKNVEKTVTNLKCYLRGTAVCSKSKCIRARMRSVSTKLAWSSRAILRRGGTVGGLKFSDL